MPRVPKQICNGATIRELFDAIENKLPRSSIAPLKYCEKLSDELDGKIAGNTLYNHIYRKLGNAEIEISNSHLRILCGYVGDSALSQKLFPILPHPKFRELQLLRNLPTRAYAYYHDDEGTIQSRFELTFKGEYEVEVYIQTPRSEYIATIDNLLVLKNNFLWILLPHKSEYSNKVMQIVLHPSENHELYLGGYVLTEIKINLGTFVLKAHEDEHPICKKWQADEPAPSEVLRDVFKYLYAKSKNKIKSKADITTHKQLWQFLNRHDLRRMSELDRKKLATYKGSYWICWLAHSEHETPILRKCELEIAVWEGWSSKFCLKIKTREYRSVDISLQSGYLNVCLAHETDRIYLNALMMGDFYPKRQVAFRGIMNANSQRTKQLCALPFIALPRQVELSQSIEEMIKRELQKHRVIKIKDDNPDYF